MSAEPDLRHRTLAQIYEMEAAGALTPLGATDLIAKYHLDAPAIEAMLLELAADGFFFRLAYEPQQAHAKPWEVAVTDGGNVAHHFYGATPEEALSRAIPECESRKNTE